MYVAAVPNRRSPPAILLRESYREGTRVKSRTLANLTSWPPAKIEALRSLLRGELSQPGPVGASLEDAFEIVRTRPHGHVAAVLGTVRRLGLEQLIARSPSRERDCVVAMICARVLDPRSKLATARSLDATTLHSTLGELLGLEWSDEDDLYEAMDWLLPRQAKIEDALAKRHVSEGTLALYDLTSTYFEGRHCPLAKLGHSRDGKKGKLQIVFGLLCDKEGRPVAVEVFEGNTGDPMTVASQVKKVRERFGLERLVIIGDRGMITSARIRADLQPASGIDWITALRAPAIARLVKGGALQLSLFDEKDLAEVVSPDFPGERLVACKNPLLAEERGRKRRELLEATERALSKIADAITREKRPLRGRTAIALRVGKVLGRFKMQKHFSVQIGKASLRCERRQDRIDAEAALDGIYVVRTSVPAEQLASEAAVRWYKQLAVVERAFRSMKTVDLKVRPIGHRKADRVRAHVFLCMLAYYVEWHMRKALAPMLFDDDDRARAEASRASVVAPAQRSERAEQKARTKRTDDGCPVHSFQSLLRDLATVAKNQVKPRIKDVPSFDKITTPTPLQSKAFELLGVSYRM
jgi:transposase